LQNIELITPGCISSCWAGNYHYLEPFVGCAYDCFYCYAKSRSIVKKALSERGAAFYKPVLFVDNKKELLKLIRQEIISKKVKVLKLSRYTDIFTPPFSSDGTSFDILKTILKTSVERIIITTKGIPDNDTVDLMCKNKEKFSFNIVVHPSYNNKVVIESFNHDFQKKLEVANKIMNGGVLTTVHLDPIIPGLDDDPKILNEYLSKLSKYGLKRLMFSYLLLNEEILNFLDKKAVNTSFIKELLKKYEKEDLQILRGQKEASGIDLKPKIKKKSIKIVSNMLEEKNFDFVICGLKSCKGSSNVVQDSSKICNGLFYA
jgi:DNA repair photolyase